ncbi:MAG: DUF4404 family protein, partial [Chloroflexales bacterium]
STAVREVNPAYSQAMLRQHQQSISDNARVGAAIAGDVHGNVTVTQQGDTGQRGGVHFGSGNRMGDVKIGDVAGRDIIKIKTVDTGGGDYAEGSIDKREGTFVSGDQFTMSGNFSGAILNIKSTLANVAQSIGAAPHGDTTTKAQLQALIEQLSAELQKVPAAQADEAEAVAESAKAVIEQVSKAKPNKALVQIKADGLKQAAQNLAAVLPGVVLLAQQIADTLRGMFGG